METISVDLVIIGCGIAGLAALMTAQEKSNNILLVTKGKLFSSGSTFCNINGRWGVSYGKTDAEKTDILNTINSIACGTNIPTLSKILVEESYAAYKRLKKWGVCFLRDSSLVDIRYPACFLSRPVASVIESTRQFAEVIDSLVCRSRVTVMENTRAIELLVDNSSCLGCVLASEGKEIKVLSKAVILATGGAAATYPFNIVEPTLIGDGYEMLKAIEVPLSNMEYVQRLWRMSKRGSEDENSVPNCLWDTSYMYADSKGSPLNNPKFSIELVASRNTHTVIANLWQDKVIDYFFLESIQENSSGGIKVYSKETGRLAFEVLPYVQACNGGVVIGPNGETGIENLYAVGEVTTGMHGGDRLGGMMVTSALVFGHRAAQSAICKA